MKTSLDPMKFLTPMKPGESGTWICISDGLADEIAEIRRLMDADHGKAITVPDLSNPMADMVIVFNRRRASIVGADDLWRVSKRHAEREGWPWVEKKTKGS